MTNADSEVLQLEMERDEAAEEARRVIRMSEEVLGEVKEVAHAVDERIRRVLEADG